MIDNDAANRPTTSGRVRRRAAAVAVAAIALVAGATGCATNPPHTVSVPGTYTVDFSAPTISYPQGGAPVAKVVMCLTEPTAVDLSSSPALDQATVEWSTGTHAFPTPVLPPGCGTLRLVVPCCYVPPTVQITLSKV